MATTPCARNSPAAQLDPSIWARTRFGLEVEVLDATLHAMTLIGVPVALAVLAVPGVRALRRPVAAPGTA